MTETRFISRAALLRFALTVAATLGLLLFLVATRIFSASDAPVLSIRNIETIDTVSQPAPPPPPQTDTPPPEPILPDLPNLDLSLDTIAPPVKANPPREIKLQLEQVEFAPTSEMPREAMTFALKELDTQPKLVSKPSVLFPKNQIARGVKEGSATLEIEISSAGRVTVLKTLSCTHADFGELARSFASRSKFTPPKKDGRPVKAHFRWPLIFRD